MALSPADRDAFLAEPHVAALSVAAGADRAPLTVPIWYQYAPGGEPWILTGTGSRKHRLIEAAGRFTLAVDRVEPTTRYVSVSGDVSRIEAGTDAQMEELAHRYLPDDAADRYLAFAREHLGDHVLIALTPRQWLSSDLGSF